MKTKLVAVFAFILCLQVNAQTKKWSIQECIAYAIENNISLKQQELNTDIQEENVVSAKGNFLPDLSASASQDWNFGSFVGQNGVRISRDSRGNTFGLNTGVTLYNGKQNRNNLERAKIGVELSDLQLAIFKDDITINILTRYIDILAQKENARIAQEQVKITEQQITQIQEFVDAGRSPRADLLDIQAQLASDQELVVNTENAVEIAILSLAELLQISRIGFDVQDVDVDISSVSLLYENPEEIYEKALATRAEIKRAELQIESAELDTDIAKGQYYPSLTFGAGMNTSYQHSQGQDDVRIVQDPETAGNQVFVPAFEDPDNLVDPLLLAFPDTRDDRFIVQDNGFSQQLSDNLGYYAGFRLNIPIFNRNQSKANVNRQKINEQIAQNNLAQEKQDLNTVIVRAYTDARASLNQYRASEASVTAQEESFRNAKESFDLGVMTSFEFEQVRIRLLNAQAAFINAKYNFIFRTKALEYYTGMPVSVGGVIVNPQ